MTNAKTLIYSPLKKNNILHIPLKPLIYYLSTIITNNNHRVDLNFSVYLLIPIYYRAILYEFWGNLWQQNKNPQPHGLQAI